MATTNKRFVAKNGLDNNSNTLANVSDPVNLQDAATKNWVINNSGGGGGVTIADDNATNATYYPTLSTITSGALSTAKIASTNLTFNPSTGTLFSTNFASSSDENLKNNIETIHNGLDIIKQINPVSFNWRDTGSKSYGVIAQELERLLPELVYDGEMKSVNYNSLIGFLIAAVKELAAKVEGA